MRAALAAGASVVVLALSACGGDEGGDAESHYENAEQIRDALVGTDFECSRWADESDTSDGSAAAWKCYTDENGMQTIQFPDDIGKWKADRVRGGAPTTWAITADGWGIDCYAQPHSKCGGLAGILDAKFVGEPGA
jgi:hypothetical protein